MSALRSSSPSAAVTVDLVIDVVAQELDVDRRHILGVDRAAATVRARHVAIWLARRVTDMSTPDLGRAFGGRDHTTILAAIARINALSRVDATARAELRALEIEVRATAAAYQAIGLPASADINVFAVARRIMGDARGATQASIAEIEALAAHVLNQTERDQEEAA